LSLPTKIEFYPTGVLPGYWMSHFIQKDLLIITCSPILPQWHSSVPLNHLFHPNRCIHCHLNSNFTLLAFFRDTKFPFHLKKKRPLYCHKISQFTKTVLFSQWIFYSTPNGLLQSLHLPFYSNDPLLFLSLASIVQFWTFASSYFLVP
jgi:hypothetical protein